MTFEEFQEKYEPKLATGCVGTLIRFGDRRSHPGTPKSAADSFLQSIKVVRPMGASQDDWIDLEWDIPRHSRHHWPAPSSHLAKALERTLAYGAPWLEPAEATQLAQDFYGLFSTGKVSRLTNRLGHGWNAITEHAIDAVYVAMDDSLIGVILVYDED